MKSYDCIFLDRDGTLNYDPGYISCLEDFNFFDFTIDTLEKLSKFGHRFCIVTNQSGVDRGIIRYESLREIHDFIKSEFKRNRISLLDIYYCTDHPSKKSTRRKPDSGMFLEAQKNYNLDLNNCLMIGDSVDDMLAGQNIPMDTMLVLTGRGKETMDLLKNKVQPTYTVENLSNSLSLLCQ